MTETGDLRPEFQIRIQDSGFQFPVFAQIADRRLLISDLDLLEGTHARATLL